MSDSIETVKVKPWSDDQGDYVLINKGVHIKPAPASPCCRQH